MKSIAFFVSAKADTWPQARSEGLQSIGKMCVTTRLNVPDMSLLLDAHRLFQRAREELAVAVAERVQAPGLAGRAEVVDRQQRFLVQNLRPRIDHIGDAEHGAEIDLPVDRDQAAEEGRNLPAVGAR